MIFFSTGGWKDKSGYEASLFLDSLGINCIELSGGKASDAVMRELRSLPKNLKLVVHNYFPPPTIPFVFNLASNNKDILHRSLEHAKQAIILASEIGLPIYSFHAGFLFDPRVNELGRRFGEYKIIPRPEGKKIFLDSINELATFANQFGIKLLIENNVISKSNFEKFGTNPLLFTDPEEAFEIMSNCPSNVFSLLDVAHLNVSANTLGFSKEVYIQNLSRWIKAYHLSENNGLEDQNHQIKDDSWFWPHLKSTREVFYTSLEIYNISENLIKEQIELCTKKMSRS